MSNQIYQLTKEEAIEFHKSGVWKDWTDEQIATMQLSQECVCFEVSRFKLALSNILGRKVYTHELVYANDIEDEFKKAIANEKT